MVKLNTTDYNRELNDRYSEKICLINKKLLTNFLKCGNITLLCYRFCEDKGYGTR